MKLPFTTAESFSVFAAYNSAVWPAQVLLVLVGLAAVALALRPTRRSHCARARRHGHTLAVDGVVCQAVGPEPGLSIELELDCLDTLSSFCGFDGATKGTRLAWAV